MTNLDQVLVANRPSVKIKGRDAKPDNLIEITIDRDFHLPSSCLLTFHDDTMSTSDALGLDAAIGDEIKVFFNQGSPVQAIMVFDGVIVAVERSFTRIAQALRVQAYDKTYQLHVGRQTRTYPNAADQSIINQIAGDAGLAMMPDSKLSSPVHEYVMQLDQTPWEFIRGRVAERGMVVRQSGIGSISPASTFKVEPAVLSGSTMTAGPGGNDDLTVLEFHPRRTALGPVKTVKVLGWDWKKKQKFTGQGTPAKGEESASGLPKDAAGGLNAAGLSDNELTLTDRLVDDQPQADNTAKAALEQVGATFAEADLVAMGDARIVPGMTLTVKNMGTDWNADWIVSSVRHTFDPTEGFLSHVTVSGRNDRSLLGLVSGGSGNGPGQAGGPPIYGAIVAVVTDTNDPENQGRVRVKFPTMGVDSLGQEVQSWWVRCVTPVAGADRGMFLPLTVEDEVLVMFERGDTRRPYVIGALYNGVDTVPKESGGATDYAKSGAASRWVLKSYTGNVIMLKDDDNKTSEIRIDVDTGKHTLVLTRQDQGKITMHSDGKIEIDANKAISIKSMDDIVIDSKKNITLKAQMSINMEATQNFEAKATAGAKISSSATLDLEGTAVTNVKGGMVNLG